MPPMRSDWWQPGWGEGGMQNWTPCVPGSCIFDPIQLPGDQALHEHGSFLLVGLDARATDAHSGMESNAKSITFDRMKRKVAREEAVGLLRPNFSPTTYDTKKRNPRRFQRLLNGYPTVHRNGLPTTGDSS